MGNNHTSLDFALIDTTEKKTNIITSFTFVKNLTEHFNTGNNRFLILTKTKYLNFITNLNLSGFDTACSNSTTTGNREDILNRHKERFVNFTLGFLNPVVNSIHKFHNLILPLSNTVKCTKSRTTDNRSILFVVILCEKFTHFHFYEFKHFLIFNKVALVQEHNKTGNVYLTSQKDMLASLRHRTVSCSNHDNCTVHLSSTRYHVLYIVGVTRAVNVSIVAF